GAGGLRALPAGPNRLFGLFVLLAAQQAADRQVRRRWRRGSWRLAALGGGRGRLLLAGAARILDLGQQVLELADLEGVVGLHARQDRARLLVFGRVALVRVVVGQVALARDVGPQHVRRVARAVDVPVLGRHLAAQRRDPLGHPAPVLHVPLRQV